jgi:hypothetical protein
MENDPTTALYMRIASLEVEVRHLNGQLVNAAAGGNYLINLIGAQQVQNTRIPQQAAIEASQQQLEQQVTQLLEENKRLEDQVIANLKQKNKALKVKVDAALKTKVALERQLEPFQNAARIGRQQEQREHADNPAEFGSWARGDAFAGNDRRDEASRVASEHVDRWVRSNKWPSDVEDCKRGPTQLVDLLTPVSELALGPKDSASMDAGRSSSSAAVKKSEKSVEKLVDVKSESPKTPQRISDEDVIRIDDHCGKTFYVHSPPSLTPTEVANGHKLRHETRSLQQPREISAGEHRSLAGNIVWIEDCADDDEYKKYWITYARHHPDFTARQWREYYEAEIRPAYLKNRKLAVEGKQPAEKKASSSTSEDKNSVVSDVQRQSSRSDLRKDSLFAQTTPSTAAPTSSIRDFAAPTVPFPSVTFGTIEEEEAEVSAYAATTTATPSEQPKPAAATTTPYEQPKSAAEKPTAELKKPFIHYNISQLKLIGNDKSIAPIEPEFSAAVILEMKHLSFHPVSKGEVKEVEIKAPSSAASAASSPKGKCFFTSCFRQSMY